MGERDKLVQRLFDEVQSLIEALQNGNHEDEVVARVLCEDALKQLLGEAA